MTFYADLPARRTRQVLADVAVVVWVVLWVQVGVAVHEVISRLAAPGRTLEQAGTSLEGGLRDAADGVSGVPLVGDGLRAPLDAAGGAASSITDAGTSLQDGVAQVALIAGLGVAAWPILGVVALWLVLRLRFARRATAAHALLAGGGDLDLFALRALSRLPLPALARVSADPAGDWRRGDPDVVRALAELELRSAGVSARAVSPRR
jgi:hypothetical protein